MQNFLDLTTGFKKEQIPDDYREQAQDNLAEIYSLLDGDDAWGFVAIFVATGTRGDGKI